MRRWSNRGGRTSVLAIPMRCSFRPGSPCFHTLDHRPLSPFCPFFFFLALSPTMVNFPTFAPFCAVVRFILPPTSFATLVQGASQSSLSLAVLDVLPASLYRAGHLDFPGPGLDTFILHSISIPHSRASLTLFLSASVSLAFNTASLIYFHRSQPHPFASVQLRHVVILPANLLLAQSSMGCCVRGETEG